MSAQNCDSCGKAKNFLECELCEESVCKSCVQFVGENTFSFLEEIPEQLTHRNYCQHCYDAEVAPELDKYNEVMEQAKQILVFFTAQRKEIPLIKKARTSYHVPKCGDRDETILRLGFLAARDGFNAVIHVEVNSRKVRNEAYQTSEWFGTGVPAMVDEKRVALQDKQNEMYR